MPHWQLFYHLVWAVRHREPLITPSVERLLYGLLLSKAVGLEGQVFALDGMPDHVHLVAAIPPKLAVATFVGQVKGASSARFNRSGLLDRPFGWQEEYAAFSLDASSIPKCIEYVRNQKRHHARGTVLDRFELQEEQERDSSSAPPPGDESPG